MELVVNARPRPLYPAGKEPGIHCTGGWLGPRAGLEGCGKSAPAPTGIRPPDRPARSESLYLLGCPGRHSCTYAERKMADFLKLISPFRQYVGDVVCEISHDVWEIHAV